MCVKYLCFVKSRLEKLGRGEVRGQGVYLTSINQVRAEKHPSYSCRSNSSNDEHMLLSEYDKKYAFQS